MTENERAAADGQPPDDLIQLYLGLLKKGPTWTPEASSEVKGNQRDHLALLSRLSRQGHLLLAGPTPSDHNLRGILIIQAETEADARAFFQDDAHIQSNRLILEIHPLFLSKAKLTQPLIQQDGTGSGEQS